VASISVARKIDAPVDVVFDTIADPKRFAGAISGVTSVELLSAAASGAGARFRQSRTVKGRETTMDFEITEAVRDQRVRIVNETHGTLWDSIFSLAPSGKSTTLTMRMDTKSRRLHQKLMMPVVMLMIRKAVEADMDALKAYCERRTSAAQQSPPRGTI